MNATLVRTIGLWLVITAQPGFAYELATHGRLTHEAYARSVLVTDPEIIRQLGIVDGKNAFGIIYYDVSGQTVSERQRQPFEQEQERMPSTVQPLSLEGWLLRGAIREDDNITPSAPNPKDDPYNTGDLLFDNRPLNHFYDPVFDRALTVGISLGKKAPNWALGTADAFSDPRTPLTPRRNHFTIFDAREAMYRALTGKTSAGQPLQPSDTLKTAEDIRKAYWATTFRALGDVVHLLEDMAQPQHTRNDPHAGSQYDNSFAPLGHKSVYEAYVDARATQQVFTTLKSTSNLPTPIAINTDALVYGDSPGYPIPVFTDYLSYFTTRSKDQFDARKGLADYSNRGFFTAGKNLGNTDYDSPSNDPNSYKPVPLALNWAGQPLDPNDPSASVTLLVPKLGVNDAFTGASEPDVPLTTQGLWDQFLEQKGKAASYTLTRPNYDAQADLLIPRAVAYSAGLINYFFRGRIGVEDAGFTANGISLRVKNAIDTTQHPEWADEVLYNQGKLVVAYEYQQPDGSVVIDSSDPVAQGQDLPPGVSSDALYEFTVPAPPPGATNIKYRLVFRGKLGQEADAVVAGEFTPTSGFVIQPNYTPQDGLQGSRNLYNASGTWRLSDKAGLVAGNIDWKGWYRNGVPTKVLSWAGPVSRYFPHYVYDKAGYAHLVIPFKTDIYQDGVVFAVAPAPVMGAAIYQDTQGRSWLVAICRVGDSDVLYRRPAIKSDSAAFYDATNNPSGWYELNRYNKVTGDQPTGVPWFFNGAGTEAQTMRSWIDPADPSQSSQLKRLKVTITDASATFDDKGNLPGYDQVGQCSGSYDANGGGSVTTSTRMTGQYIVAVDYKDSQEVLASIAIDETDTDTAQITVTTQQDAQGQVISKASSGTHTTSNHRRETLKWGGPDVTVFSDANDVTTTWDTSGVQITSASNATDQYQWAYNTYYLDLRNDIYSYSYNYSDKTLTNGAGTGTFGDATRILAASNLVPSPLVLFDQKTQSIPITGSGGDVILYGTPGPCQAPPSEHLWIGETNFMNWTYPGIEGSWAVDTKGNFFASQLYYSDGGYTPHDPYNYFSAGDLTTLAPGATSSPAYYPIGVIR